MIDVLAQIMTPPTNNIVGTIDSLIVYSIVGLQVWLVKKLVDNNQKILDSVKTEALEERKLHREDIRTIVAEAQKYRETSEKNFNKIANAMDKIAEKIDNLSLGMDTSE